MVVNFMLLKGKPIGLNNFIRQVNSIHAILFQLFRYNRQTFLLFVL